jgi:hypothetical protein
MPNLPVNLESAMGKNTLNRIRAMDASGAEERVEDYKVDQAVAEQLRALDEKTMNMRALIFWGIFLVVSSVVAVLFYVKH